MINKSDFQRIDFALIVAVCLLAVIGILSIYSAGFDPIEKVNTNLYRKQMIVFIIGLIAMVAVSVVNYQRLGEASLVFFGITLLFVIGTTFLGSTTRGTSAWMNLGVMKVQPSEFMKLAAVILLAKYIEMRERDLRYFRELLIPAVIILIPMTFILLQPDFGTAMIFVPVLFAMLFVGGADVVHLVSIIVIAAITLIMPMIVTSMEWAGMTEDNPLLDFYLKGSSPFIIALILLFVGLIAYILHVFIIKKYFRKIYIPAFVFSLGLLFSVLLQRLLKDYQKKRILVFLNPDLDPHGSGYNVIQAKIAVGSGGFFGKGFMKGSQTQLGYLPEKWTDFIFAVIAEEWGFLGALVTIFLLGFIIYKGLIISLTTRDKYASLLAAGITTIFLSHIIINIGMVVGIMPVTGLPLCFLSYGGSNLLMSMIGVGILLSINMRR